MTVHLRRQTAQVLGVLAERPGEVVDHETLFERVWPNVATTSDSLVQCISELRKVLGPEVIETFPRKGYCLHLTSERPRGLSVRRRRLAGLAMLATIVLAVGVIETWRFLGGRSPAITEQVIVPPPIAPELTIAVLPFLTLGGTERQQFFGQGLSADLSTDLSKVPRLTVVSYESSADFPDAEQGFAGIAENLGVRYLVRGTVRHDAGRVRINVAMVDSADGANLWAERYERPLGDPFDMQERVTREIVDALSLELGTEARPAPETTADAYFMLMRGLEPLRERSTLGNLEARIRFRDAIALDPGYARAHALLAVTYGREVGSRRPQGATAPSRIQTGLESAVRAIQLDPDLPAAYLALGVLNLALGEHPAALSAARHALRLDRNYSDGYALLAEIAVSAGDLDEGLDAIRRAKRLHPHHPFTYDWLEGHLLLQMDSPEEAATHLRSAIEASPLFAEAYICLAAALGTSGQSAEGRAILALGAQRIPSFDAGATLARMRFHEPDRRARLAGGLARLEQR